MNTEEFISKKDAATITRIFVRIQEQIEYATVRGTAADAVSLCRIMGQLQYRVFGEAWFQSKDGE